MNCVGKAQGYLTLLEQAVHIGTTVIQRVNQSEE